MITPATLMTPALLLTGSTLIACTGETVEPPPEQTDGNVRVTVQATNALSGTAYRIDFDGAEAGLAEAGESVHVVEVPAGDHTVQVTVPIGCDVAGDNPRTITVVAGETVATTFDVDCVAELTVWTITFGTNEDPDGYQFRINGGLPQPIGVFEGITADVPPGMYTVTLSGVADNCIIDGENPVVVPVPPGLQAAASFELTCE